MLSEDLQQIMYWNIGCVEYSNDNNDNAVLGKDILNF